MAIFVKTGVNALSKSPWSDDNIEVLRRLWAEGRSAGMIADELGLPFTRCAVLGKINRLGLLRRRKHTPAGKKKKRLARRPMMMRRSMVPQTLLEPAPVVPAPEPRRLQLMELEAHNCRWPYGDPQRKSFYFCGHDSRPGEVYCPFHMRRAFSGAR